MKPALFSVLCEIKEKTGERFYTSFLYSLLLLAAAATTPSALFALFAGARIAPGSDH